MNKVLVLSSRNSPIYNLNILFLKTSNDLSTIMLINKKWMQLAYPTKLNKNKFNYPTFNNGPIDTTISTNNKFGDNMDLWNHAMTLFTGSQRSL